LEQFIEQSIKIHNNFYSYEKSIYINDRTKLKIKCPKHGYFWQIPTHHLKGSGCPKCAIEKLGWNYSKWEKISLQSKHFDSFKVYIIECWNEFEKFYKIGKTFKTIKKRFNNKASMPYNYKIIKIFENKDSEYISKLENKLHIKNKEFKYIPKKEFYGNSECFFKFEI